MPKQANHNARTIKLLQSEGWTVEKTEHWVERKRYLAKHELDMLAVVEAKARSFEPVASGHVLKLVDLVRDLTKLGAGHRKDLFGFADFIGCRPAIFPENGIRLFQVTSRSNISSRRNKIKAADAFGPWTAAGGTVEILGFYKDGRLWQVKREMVQP